MLANGAPATSGDTARGSHFRSSTAVNPPTEIYRVIPGETRQYGVLGVPVGYGGDHSYGVRDGPNRGRAPNLAEVA